MIAAKEATQLFPLAAQVCLPLTGNSRQGLPITNTNARQAWPLLSSTSQQACWQIYDKTPVGRLVGLDYFGARYFSGAQGRFVSADVPLVDQNVENPQSWNLYAYARNNRYETAILTAEFASSASAIRAMRNSLLRRLHGHPRRQETRYFRLQIRLESLQRVSVR